MRIHKTDEQMTDDAMAAAVAQNRRLLGLPPQEFNTQAGCPLPHPHGPHMLEVDLPDGSTWHIQCVGRTPREARTATEGNDHD